MEGVGKEGREEEEEEEEGSEQDQNYDCFPWLCKDV